MIPQPPLVIWRQFTHSFQAPAAPCPHSSRQVWPSGEGSQGSQRSCESGVGWGRGRVHMMLGQPPRRAGSRGGGISALTYPPSVAQASVAIPGDGSLKVARRSGPARAIGTVRPSAASASFRPRDGPCQGPLQPTARTLLPRRRYAAGLDPRRGDAHVPGRMPGLVQEARGQTAHLLEVHARPAEARVVGFQNLRGQDTSITSPDFPPPAHGFPSTNMPRRSPGVNPKPEVLFTGSLNQRFPS